MPIYARPTKSLMTDWVKEHLKPGQTFSRSDVSRWFLEHYPNIKRTTVNMHVDGMSTNNPNRKHHPSIKPGSGHDLTSWGLTDSAYGIKKLIHCRCTNKIS